MPRYLPPNRERVHSVKRVSDRHQELIRRVVRGDRPGDIANAMGMTRAWVSVCKNSPALRERIDTLQNEANNYITTARQRIDELSARSLDVLEGILKDKDDKTITPRLKVDVAKDILDRAGHGAVKKVESKNLHASLSKEDVDKIVGRAFSVDLSEIIEGEVVSD